METTKLVNLLQAGVPVILNGQSAKSLELVKAASKLLGVGYVVINEHTRSSDFERFQSPDGDYYAPVVINEIKGKIVVMSNVTESVIDAYMQLPTEHYSLVIIGDYENPRFASINIE